MAFVDNMLGRFSQAGQNIGKKAKDLSEYARLSSVISEAEKEINALYSRIGNEIYIAYKDNPLPEVTDQITRITELMISIEQAKASQKMLTESETCPECGAAVKPGMKFCGTCGCRIHTNDNETAGAGTAEIRLCSQCGTPIREGMLFCTSCGTPVTSPDSSVDSDSDASLME